MLEMLGNIFMLVSGFCIFTAIILIIIMKKTTKKMSDKKIGELYDVIRKPLFWLGVLCVAGLTFFIVGRVLIL